MNNSLSDLNFRVSIRVKICRFIYFLREMVALEKYKFDRSWRHAEYRLDIDFRVLINKLLKNASAKKFLQF